MIKNGWTQLYDEHVKRRKQYQQGILHHSHHTHHIQYQLQQQHYTYPTYQPLMIGLGCGAIGIILGIMICGLMIVK